MNFEETKAYLYSIGGSSRGRDNFEEFLEKFDNPHKKIETVQVLGTNGKGSTTAFLQKLMENKGKRIATFTSPAIMEVFDRIQVNRRDISESDFLRIFNLIINEAKFHHLGFFEILCAIAFIYFAEQKVDYAIIEAGIGGKRDATSVINAKARLLTNVGYDHTELLGESIEEILLQKLGACRNGDTLITTITKPSEKMIVSDYCIKNNVNVIYVEKSIDYKLNLIGEYQKSNASLAYACIKYLNISLTEEEIKNAFALVKWSGRFEKIKENFYIDGAHNINGVISSIKTANNIFGKGNYKIVSSVLKGKDIYKFNEIFCENASEVVFTTFNYPRAYTSKELCKLNLNIDLELTKILDEALNSSENYLFIGSLYFMTEILIFLKEVGHYND